jgi:uncharacterized protein
MSEVQHRPRAVAGIDREQIIATLRAHQAELHRRGGRHVASFGSIARGEGKRTSDTDILIEFDRQAPVGLFEYVEIMQYLADLFPLLVDIANRSSLKPLVRPTDRRNLDGGAKVPSVRFLPLVYQAEQMSMA